MRIVIPLFDGFTALDVVGPYEILRMLPEADIVFSANAPGPCTDGEGHLRLLATAFFQDVEEADVLVVPGGPGARRSLADESLLDWIRRIHATTQWTTSVCTGSLLLGAAGLLDGLEATTHRGAVDALESYGATYTARRVVEQPGGIVTAAGVSSGIDMALRLAELIAGRIAAEAFPASGNIGTAVGAENDHGRLAHWLGAVLGFAERSPGGCWGWLRSARAGGVSD